MVHPEDQDQQDPRVEQAVLEDQALPEDLDAQVSWNTY